MKFYLYKVSGYEEAIMAIRMSKGKYYSWEKAQHVQDLVYAVTNKQGFLATPEQYEANLRSLGWKENHPKVTGNYEQDVKEFKRLLGMVMNHGMGEFDHHTLIKYIDVSFFTDGLHRGGQDDLDSHAIAFNNRITRFSTRLAEIEEPKVSEWYQDKIIPFNDAFKLIGNVNLPEEIIVDGEVFKYTPFGYILKKFVDMSPKNGLRKDVFRGLIPLGYPGCGLWKCDLFNLRYIYFRRSKLTKANPELREGMEQLADQIEEKVPVFGPYFRKKLTDSGKWEHMNKVKTITAEEFREFMEWKQKKSEKNLT